MIPKQLGGVQVFPPPMVQLWIFLSFNGAAAPSHAPEWCSSSGDTPLNGTTVGLLVFQWCSCTSDNPFNGAAVPSHGQERWSSSSLRVRLHLFLLSMVHPSLLWLSAFSPSPRAENPLKGATAPPPQPKIPNFPLVWMVRLSIPSQSSLFLSFLSP